MLEVQSWKLNSQGEKGEDLYAHVITPVDFNEISTVSAIFPL
jgi:hypothetical protein